MINTQIGGRYLLQQRLGAGGMGTVYHARDLQTDQRVAVKHLHLDGKPPDILERFRREGEALRALNHPNIVKMLDTVDDAGQHYLVMEYVSGGDLRHELEQRGPLPVQACLELAIDLADALTRAHRLNIIHRDLKPANILIAEDGTLRLTDFGVAHIGSQQRVTETDAIIGTIDYLPPETFANGDYDARGDIWAFGVMLFEVLAGQRPFSGESMAETLYAITAAPVPDFEALRPDAPTALVDLVYRMLEKDPLARIPSVRIVGAELEAILAGRDQPAVVVQTDPDTSERSATRKHNLPVQMTAFVGREHELIEVTRLLDRPENRLVTILGPGGMGKTRLALEVAAQRLHQHTDGVFFVDLSPLSEADRIVNAIGDAVDFSFQQADIPPLEQLNHFLSRRDLLLVLDNYEHLLDGAGLVTELLQAAPGLQLLVTSRQRLNQSGETVFQLGGFDLAAWATPEYARASAAVRLFMQGARRTQVDFDLTPDNLPHIARICHQVEGLPLGIVLAASWLGMLTPAEVADEIATGIAFLETDLSDLPERQRSVRAVFDYSWQLLDDAERLTFMKLSVFRGGFTRDAAQGVTGASLRMLMTLVNKSLLRRDAQSGRYTIHELLRQYAETRLTEAGLRVETQRTHARYYGTWMASVEEEIKYQRSVEVMNQIDADFSNIRMGFLRAAELGDPITDAYSETLMQYKNRRNLWYTGEEVFSEAMARWPDKTALTYDRLLLRYASLVAFQSFTGATSPQRDRARTLLMQIDFDRLPPYEQCRYYMALIDKVLGTEEPQTFETYIAKALERAEAVGDNYLIIQCRWFMMRELTSPVADELIALAPRVGDDMFIGAVRQWQSALAIRTHDFEATQRYAIEAQKIFTRMGNAWGEVVTAGDVSQILFHKGALDEGLHVLKVARQRIEDHRMTRFADWIAHIFTTYMLAQGEYAAAKDALEQIADEDEAMRSYAPYWLAYGGLMVADWRNLPQTINAAGVDHDSRYQQFAGLGVAVAIYHARNGDAEAAAEVLGASDAYAYTPDWWVTDHPLVMQVIAEVKAALSKAAFDAAWQHGQTQDLEALLSDFANQNDN